MTVAEQEEVGKAALEYGKWLGEIAVFISECGDPALAKSRIADGLCDSTDCVWEDAVHELGRVLINLKM